MESLAVLHTFWVAAVESLAVLHTFWVAAAECLAVLDAFWVAAADDWRLFVCSGLAGKIAGGNPRLF